MHGGGKEAHYLGTESCFTDNLQNIFLFILVSGLFCPVLPAASSQLFFHGLDLILVTIKSSSSAREDLNPTDLHQHNSCHVFIRCTHTHRELDTFRTNVKFGTY